MPLDNAIRDGQTQSTTTVVGAGGVEGLEDAVEMLGGDTWAGIGETHLDLLAIAPGRDAQGAAMGLEDAAVLSRCVSASNDWPTAIARYERTRIGRTSKIQLGSHQNQWLREAGNPDWVYGYDAWQARIV